ncbi:protein of unknown function [Shewanella benthica]|uniref:Uncharacterized protein n=1 Tax=Shewanella benthica TaxID=43661 RepID=A0A330M549_9GAMM|nr:protein of unknown function [Shewanella benthica]
MIAPEHFRATAKGAPTQLRFKQQRDHALKTPGKFKSNVELNIINHLMNHLKNSG